MSAEDVITKSQEADINNYRMEGGIDFSLNVTADAKVLLSKQRAIFPSARPSKRSWNAPRLTMISL